MCGYSAQSAPLFDEMLHMITYEPLRFVTKDMTLESIKYMETKGILAIINVDGGCSSDVLLYLRNYVTPRVIMFALLRENKTDMIRKLVCYHETWKSHGIGTVCVLVGYGSESIRRLTCLLDLKLVTISNILSFLKMEQKDKRIKVDTHGFLAQHLLNYAHYHNIKLGENAKRMLTMLKI